MKSPEWAKRRIRSFARDKCCVKCGSKENLECDHLCYPSRLLTGDAAMQAFISQKDEEFQTLCRTCHRKKTAIERRNRNRKKK